MAVLFQVQVINTQPAGLICTVGTVQSQQNKYTFHWQSIAEDDFQLLKVVNRYVRCFTLHILVKFSGRPLDEVKAFGLPLMLQDSLDGADSPKSAREHGRRCNGPECC